MRIKGITSWLRSDERLLAFQDRARLRAWFDAQDMEETDELLAAIDDPLLRF